MIKRILGFVIIGTLLFPSMASAQGTLLPDTIDLADIEITDELREQGIDTPCEYFMEYVGAAGGSHSAFKNGGAEDRQNILSCAIQTGEVRLWMLPYYISYIANFFIGIAGIVSLLFVVIGGFWYMTGGLTDDKEKGKKTIMYALLGFVITLLAWIIVNVIQVQVTS